MLAKIMGYSAMLTEQENCFILQHIDNKAQFYCRKAEYNLYFGIFLPETRIYIYRRISVDYGRRMFSAPLDNVTMC